MNADRAAFALMVRQTIRNHPDWISTANEAIQSGVTEALEIVSKEKADWETVAVNAMHSQLFKRNKLWLADMIEKLQPTAAMRWTDVIARLRS